jgi:hypothetical protein
MLKRFVEAYPSSRIDLVDSDYGWWVRAWVNGRLARTAWESLESLARTVAKEMSTYYTSPDKPLPIIKANTRR